MLLQDTVYDILQCSLLEYILINAFSMWWLEKSIVDHFQQNNERISINLIPFVQNIDTDSVLSESETFWCFFFHF